MDFGFVEFRGFRPPNLLIVNSHLSIVNGQGGIGGIFLGGMLTKSTRCVDEILLLWSRTKSLRDEILAALGLHFDSGDELGPGLPDAPAGEDTGEPGMLGGHILDVGFLILDL